MIPILCLIAVIVAIVTAIRLNSWQRMARSSVGMTHTLELTRRIDKTTTAQQEKNQRIKAIVADIFKDIKIFPYSDDYQREVNQMLVALDKKDQFGKHLTVDDIFVQQCLWSFSSIGIGFLLTLAMSISFGGFTAAGMLAVLTAPFLFHVPLMNLRSEFKESQLIAMSQWLEFYNMYYTQFMMKDSTAQLPDVIDNFLPLANTELTKILSIFKNDLTTHEVEVALDKLKKRYPSNTRIHKFVSVAKMRQANDEGAFDMMKSVQEDYIAEENLAYTKELKWRLQKAGFITNVVIYTGLAMLFTVMIIAMVV